MSSKILTDVCKVYSDCNDWNEQGFERQLDFKADTPVSPYECLEILKRAIPDGYNNFVPSESLLPIISVFGADCQVWIARESSPCLYIKPGKSKVVWFNRRASGVENIGADEVSLQPDGTIRLWWD